jgi:hypothetical protein
MFQTVFECGREGLDIVTWFVSTAGVGGRHLKPATPVRCTLLRKPTEGVNCNGRHGVLSTEVSLNCSLLPENQRAGTDWNDKDFQLLIQHTLSCRSLCCWLIGKETEYRGATAG